jgi:glycosyltransferase involved in cell wall biosynthesis
VPAVGTRVGDVAHLLSQPAPGESASGTAGRTGWLVDPGRPEPLADALLEALADPAAAQAAAGRAHDLLTREHSPARQAELWHALLNETQAGARKASRTP